jgi:hemolysin activation/secretion protein
MNKYSLGLIAIIVCVSTTMWGSTAPVAARTVLDNQYNQQQQQWGADQSYRQLESHKKLDALRIEWPTQSHRMAVSTGPVVPIQKISIRGATVMGRKEQRRLVRAFEGTDMDMQAMEALVHVPRVYNVAGLYSAGPVDGIGGVGD